MRLKRYSSYADGRLVAVRISRACGAQVGAEPQLVTALEDLLDEQGCEIYIKRCDRYGMANGSRVTWAQVRQRAWGR